MAKNYDKQRAKMRDLYVGGMPIEEIAALFEIDVRTVHYHKARDQERTGLDWETLRVERSLGEENFAERNKQFLCGLFSCFEEDRRKLAEERDVEKRLALLERYSTCYHKLVVAARRTEPGAELQEIISRTLKKLSELAMAHGRADIVSWLIEAMSEIQDMVRQEFKA